jgi:hypothetical protein
MKKCPFCKQLINLERTTRDRHIDFICPQCGCTIGTGHVLLKKDKRTIANSVSPPDSYVNRTPSLEMDETSKINSVPPRDREPSPEVIAAARIPPAPSKVQNIEYKKTTIATTPSESSVHSEHQDTKSDYFIDFIAAELKKDINYLAELGVKLDKGKLAAKTGGVGWAGYEAVTGDWLSALVVGGISLLAGGLTNSYKRIKVKQMQQKWNNRFSELNRDQMAYLVEGLNRKYPLILHGFQNLLIAGE